MGKVKEGKSPMNGKAANFPNDVSSCKLMNQYELDEFSERSSICSDSSDKSEGVAHDPSFLARDQWSGRADFILSCVGYAVGLGNIWRFPYLCYSNGGGAFLVPYFIFLTFCGVPMIVLEMCLGQFTGLSATVLYRRFCPMFQGIGWGMAIVSGICCVYYNMIIAWTLYYLYLSFRRVPPWKTCGNTWNTPLCVTDVGKVHNRLNISAMNSSDPIFGDYNATLDLMDSVLNVSNAMSKYPQNWTTDSLLAAGLNVSYNTASEEFWEKYVLNISSGIEEMGTMQWDLFICLFVAWILVFCCLFKGVKSSGRVVYVTATFPYLVLFILLIRGLTLPGAAKGLRFYLVPQWHRLKDINVWVAAASQIFYSVGMAWGTLIAFSSYNKFNHNIYRDALIIPVVNAMTSVFAGLVVFSILGFMAKTADVEVDKIIASGPGLTFVVYPEAIAKLPISPLWGVLFFTMILSIGVGSQSVCIIVAMFIQFGMFQTLISALIDEFPDQLRKRKTPLTALFCFLMFCAGIPMAMRGGMFVLQMMDWYCATFSVMLIAFCESLVVTWCYGYRRFMEDIKMMVRYTPCPYWMVCWGFVSPGIIAALLLSTIIFHKPVTLGKAPNLYTYPAWASQVGLCIALLSVLPLPAFAIYNMVTAKGSFMKRLRHCLRPTPAWGPTRLADRIMYRKSLNAVPTRQKFVKGVDDQMEEGADVNQPAPAYVAAAAAGAPQHSANGLNPEPPPPYPESNAPSNGGGDDGGDETAPLAAHAEEDPGKVEPPPAAPIDDLTDVQEHEVHVHDQPEGPVGKGW